MTTGGSIRVEGVSKKFCRSLKRSLWYGLTDMAREIAGGSRPYHRLRESEFWAVRDVCFELEPGDSLGLIGANGAGKTTLLRMLSGLIKPDAGRIEVRGQLQALVALGAGFNPILTGRENIYVNGAVLGIPRREIERRFDEIVDFSGISEFIEAPVQSYSSGMVVRLGFSVAIHMDPDILLVDEVLAVGDQAFRVKCSKKLGELKDKGVPWILVSHDMGTIRNQTNKVVVLDRGRCSYIGPPEDAIAHYLVSVSSAQAQATAAMPANVSSTPVAPGPAQITAVRLLDENGAEKAVFRTGDALTVRIDLEAKERIEKPSIGIAFYGGDGTCFTGTNTANSGFPIESIEGRECIEFQLEHLPLLPGVYRIRIDLHDKHMGMLDSRTEATWLHVGGGAFGAGSFLPKHCWSMGEKD